MRYLPMSTYFMAFVFGMPLLFSSCEATIPIDDIDRPPAKTEADQQYTDVFQPLDGQWKGTFKIYLDTLIGPINQNILSFPNKETLVQLPIKLSDSILVEQTYTSITPFFQTVNITDYYPAKAQSVESKGVNKVQNGQMWCVVRKPDETIIHRGSLDGEKTIIWQRNIADPLSKEYFRETVLENTYEIVGWGYYSESDTTRMPPYWFYGLYHKTK